jgi:hypothetical protein
MLQETNDGILNGLGWLITHFFGFFYDWFVWSDTLPPLFECLSLFCCVGLFVVIVRSPFALLKIIRLNSARRAAGKEVIPHNLGSYTGDLDQINEKERL